MAKNKPVFTAKYGAVQLAIFENDIGEGKVVKSISINKSYKDGESFKTTTSFKGSDIPLIEGCLKEAFDYLYKKEQVPF